MRLSRPSRQSRRRSKRRARRSNARSPVDSGEPDVPRQAILRFLVPLVFASGACALIYQAAWLRLLRLVFGTSSSASAAVMAIFLGGLGLGALVLGRRADAARNPVRLYAYLELAVAVGAALSPMLITLVRSECVEA